MDGCSSRVYAAEIDETRRQIYFLGPESVA